MEMSLLFKINSLEQAQVEGVLASSVEVMANFEAWKGGSGIDRKGSVARDIHRPQASNHNFVAWILLLVFDRIRGISVHIQDLSCSKTVFVRVLHTSIRNHRYFRSLIGTAKNRVGSC